MYLASPMPKVVILYSLYAENVKIIDQTYSSLTTMPQRQPRYSPNIPRRIPKNVISNIPGSVTSNAENCLSEGAGSNVRANTANEPFNLTEITPPSPPATIDNFTDEQHEERITESRKGVTAMKSSDTLAALSDDFDNPDVEISVRTIFPRKRRKSRFKSTQIFASPLKPLEPPAKRRRVYTNAKDIQPSSKSVTQNQVLEVTNEEISLIAKVCKVSTYMV